MPMDEFMNDGLKKRYNRAATDGAQIFDWAAQLVSRFSFIVHHSSFIIPGWG